MSEPVIVATDGLHFRIVRQGDGDSTTYIVETPDNCDAMGVPRWREFKLEAKTLKALRDYIIRAAIKETPRAEVE